MLSIEYLRQFRFGGFAAFDIIASVFGMLVLAPALSWGFSKIGIHIPKRSWVLWTLPLSVIAHVLAGTMTPLTKNVLDPNGHLVSKIVILGFLILGMIGIKKTRHVTR